MHPVRKQRLILVIFVVLISATAVGLILFSLGKNLNAFYSPTDIVAGGVPTDKTIRAGGCVVPGTVKETGRNLEVFFEIADHNSRITVSFDGLLPDLFGEGEAAVVIGTLDANNVITAHEVLAKHDEEYMPPEVTDTLKKKAEETGEEFSLTCQDLNL